MRSSVYLLLLSMLSLQSHADDVTKVATQYFDQDGNAVNIAEIEQYCAGRGQGEKVCQRVLSGWSPEATPEQQNYCNPKMALRLENKGTRQAVAYTSVNADAPQFFAKVFKGSQKTLLEFYVLANGRCTKARNALYIGVRLYGCELKPNSYRVSDTHWRFTANYHSSCNQERGGASAYHFDIQFIDGVASFTPSGLDHVVLSKRLGKYGVHFWTAESITAEDIYMLVNHVPVLLGESGNLFCDTELEFSEDGDDLIVTQIARRTPLPVGVISMMMDVNSCHRSEAFYPSDPHAMGVFQVEDPKDVVFRYSPGKGSKEKGTWSIEKVSTHVEKAAGRFGLSQWLALDSYYMIELFEIVDDIPTLLESSKVLNCDPELSISVDKQSENGDLIVVQKKRYLPPPQGQFGLAEIHRCLPYKKHSDPQYKDKHQTVVYRYRRNAGVATWSVVEHFETRD